MANPTSNFGWQMPTPTDLVTDLPADFEVFGQAVDTSLADLKGGTTGQVLAKNSNTDMDFVWVTDAAGDITGVTAGTGISGGGTSGTVTVTNSMATAIDAKGDLVAGTGADAFARLGVGTNGQVLTADSTAATGLAWATSTTGGFTLITETTAAAASSISFTSISGSYKHLMLVWDGLTHSATGSQFTVRLNNDSSALYNTRQFGANGSTLINTAGSSETAMGPIGAGGVGFMGLSSNVSSTSVNAPMGVLWIYDYASASKFKQFEATGGFYNNGSAYQTNFTANGVYNSTTAVTRLDIVRLSGSATLTNDTSTSVRLYGVS